MIHICVPRRQTSDHDVLDFPKVKFGSVLARIPRVLLSEMQQKSEIWLPNR